MEGPLAYGVGAGIGADALLVASAERNDVRISLRRSAGVLACTALVVVGVVAAWSKWWGAGADLQTARAAFDQRKYEEAADVVTLWLARGDGTDARVAVALLLRGDARVAMKDLWHALFDYEAIARDHAATPEFRAALERELEMAIKLVHGQIADPRFGDAKESANDYGRELLTRVCERLPGSDLAETAMWELAQHYERDGQAAIAAEVYGMLVSDFPKSSKCDAAREKVRELGQGHR
jgi:hypothetical protein